MMGTTEIFLVGNLIQPLDVFSIERFLDCNVRHGGGRRRTVPMLVARRAPDDIPCANLDDLLALALGPTATGRNDERLAKRVRVPCRPRTGLERDIGAGHTSRLGGGE